MVLQLLEVILVDLVVVLDLKEQQVQEDLETLPQHHHHKEIQEELQQVLGAA